MADDESRPVLDEAALADLASDKFEQAEAALRNLIARVDSEDVARRWYLFSVLGGVLNMLDRPAEGTEMYRRSLVEARRLGPSREVEVATYALANQHLIFGDPEDALAEATPAPAGKGHTQCLLHAVAAEALWKLNRHDQARVSAQSAITACPTDERRVQMSEQLAYILRVG